MKYGNICDIHFFNEYRRTDYKYSDEFEKPFIIL